MKGGTMLVARVREKLPQGLVGGLDRLLLADAAVACAESVDGVELSFARDTVLATDVMSVVCRDATVRDRLRGLHAVAYPQPSPAWPPWVRELARTAADADDRPIRIPLAAASPETIPQGLLEKPGNRRGRARVVEVIHVEALDAPRLTVEIRPDGVFEHGPCRSPAPADEDPVRGHIAGEAIHVTTSFRRRSRQRSGARALEQHPGDARAGARTGPCTCRSTHRLSRPRQQ